MTLETKSLVVGEVGIRRDSALVLSVVNRSDEAIRLPTEATSRWMADSPYWSIEVNGPVDARCIEHELNSVATLPPGETPHVEVGPGEERRLPLPGLGIGNVGAYRISVAYHGEGAPAGYLQTDLRTSEVVLRVLPPGPTELAVVDEWRERNPNSPWCLFPLGMDLASIADEHPQSIYAGWYLWGRLRSHLGGFPGEPSAASPTDFVRFASVEGQRVLYDEPFESKTSTKQSEVLRKGAAAHWRRSKIETFLTAHPDFEKADEMRLRLAMDDIGLGDFDSATRRLGAIVSRDNDNAASNRAVEYLELLERRTNSAAGSEGG